MHSPDERSDELCTPEFSPAYRAEHKIPATLVEVQKELQSISARKIAVMKSITGGMRTKKGTLRKISVKITDELEALSQRETALLHARDLLALGITFGEVQTISPNVVDLAEAVETVRVRLRLMKIGEPSSVTQNLQYMIVQRVREVFDEVAQ